LGLIDKKNYYFHGFLGNSSEHGFVNEVHGFDLYELSLLSDDQINQRLSRISFKDKTLIGYSLGGRFILRYLDFFSEAKKIYLLGAHPGIQDQVEKNHNEKWFKKNQAKIKNSTLSEFLDHWNEQAIFKNDPSVLKVNKTMEEICMLFSRWPRFEQLDYSLTIKNDPRIHFLVGQKDQKYVQLISTNFTPNRFSIVEGHGHRLNKPEVIARLL
jgi:pimeloyl-ACP methyl ester carboxylesterase